MRIAPVLGTTTHILSLPLALAADAKAAEAKKLIATRKAMLKEVFRGSRERTSLHDYVLLRRGHRCLGNAPFFERLGWLPGGFFFRIDYPTDQSMDVCPVVSLLCPPLLCPHCGNKDP